MKILFKDILKIENILLDINKSNPFPAPPAAIDFHNNPPQFICGRTEEINQIKEDMLNSINYKEPKLIKIFGTSFTSVVAGVSGSQTLILPITSVALT